MNFDRPTLRGIPEREFGQALREWACEKNGHPMYPLVRYDAARDVYRCACGTRAIAQATLAGRQ